MKNKQKHSLFLDIGMLIDKHLVETGIRFDKCKDKKCTICKEIQTNRFLLEKKSNTKVSDYKDLKKQNRYKVYVMKDGQIKEFNTIKAASLFLNLKKNELTQKFFDSESDVVCMGNHEITRRLRKNEPKNKK